MGPLSASIRAMAVSTAALSVTSKLATSTVWPWARRLAAASASLAWLRAFSTTVAPASASPPASARPMPWLEPVTRARRPVRSNNLDGMARSAWLDVAPPVASAQRAGEGASPRAGEGGFAPGRGGGLRPVPGMGASPRARARGFASGAGDGTSPF